MEIELSVQETEVLLDSLKACPTCQKGRYVIGYSPLEQQDLYGKLKYYYIKKVDEKLIKLGMIPLSDRTTGFDVEYIPDEITEEFKRLELLH